MLPQAKIVTQLANSSFCIARHLTRWQIYTIVHAWFFKKRKQKYTSKCVLNIAQLKIIK